MAKKSKNKRRRNILIGVGIILIIIVLICVFMYSGLFEQTGFILSIPPSPSSSGNFGGGGLV